MAFKQHTWVSHHSGGWESKVKASADQGVGLVRELPVFSLCVCLHGGKGEGAPCGLVYKGTDPIHEDSAEMPRLQTPPHQGLGFKIGIWGRYRPSVHNPAIAAHTPIQGPYPNCLGIVHALFLQEAFSDCFGWQ